MSNYGSKQGKASDSELQALALRVAALERDAYQRGKDVDIGMPASLARQASRTPRLILVDPTTGIRYVAYVDGSGTVKTTPL